MGPAAHSATLPRRIPFRPRTAGLHDFVIIATRPGVVEAIGNATLVVTEAMEPGTIYFPIVKLE
jgi:hypothetical protein